MTFPSFTLGTFGLAASALLLGGCGTTPSPTKTAPIVTTQNEATVWTPDEMAAMGDHKTMTGEAKMVDDAMMNQVNYQVYTPALLASLQGKQKVALFFHASWCPSCRTADKDLTANVTALGGAVLKVDYDSETELKKKYAITSQHTVVFLNADGSVAGKKMGFTTADVQQFFAQ